MLKTSGEKAKSKTFSVSITSKVQTHVAYFVISMLTNYDGVWSNCLISKICDWRMGENFGKLRASFPQ